jgi:murein DD-endopeptidase MepM/ murein hydrolase activator NlpD
VIFLGERTDGRLLAYLPADPAVLLTEGERTGDAILLRFAQEDPGLGATVVFSGTLAPDGGSMLGEIDDGSGPVAASFTRWLPALTVEHWLLVDFDQDQVVRASRLHDGAGGFVTGGFVGLRGCGFLACAGDWLSWSIAGDDHVIASASAGTCPPASSLTGTWSATDRFLSGTYSTTDCSDTTMGTWGGGRVGFTTSADVLAGLRTAADLLDAFEAESLDVLDAFTAGYVHDGRTLADVSSDLTAMYAAFDDLQAGASLREVISDNSGEEFPDVAAPPRLAWRLEVTGVPSAGGPRQVVLALDTAELDQQELHWIAMDGGTARFSGNGHATPFEIEMPIAPADSVQTAYGLWPWGVHGGGHPEGHPGWDVEFAMGTQVRAVADGTVSAIQPNDGYADQWQVTVAHRPGRSTRYDHLENLQPGIVVGASVVAGQPIADAGNVGTIHLTHFAVQSGIDTLCPEPFLSAGGRAVFDAIWAGATYNEELCEPLPCNPRDLVFPLTRAWQRESGALAPRIEFTRLDPTTPDYRYTLRDAGGVALETGDVVQDPQAVPYPTLDLLPDGGGATHLGVYDIVGDLMSIDWSDVARPASLAGAGQYRFAP